MSDSTVSSIEARISKFNTEHGEEAQDLAEKAAKLFAASRVLEDSWSGSFAGWHATMYFKDFERPPTEERFNGEWGGIHGIPENWEEKSTDEVAAKLDTMVDKGFSGTQFAERVKAFRTALRDLADDVSLIVADLTVPKSQKAIEILEAVSHATFSDTSTRYATGRMPKSLMTRDSEAIRQGIRLPDWLYFQAIAADGQTLADEFSTYLKRVTRLVELASKTANSVDVGAPAHLDGMPLHPVIVAKCSTLYKAGTYAEAVEKSFKTVRDRLRQLTGFERGADAFGRGNLHVLGAAAPNVEQDFNEAVKFLLMAIDNFRNEKSHTSDANIADPARALQYLAVSSLAMSLLDQAEVRP